MYLRDHHHKLGIASILLFGCFSAAGQSASDIATFAAIRASVRETIQGRGNFNLVQYQDKKYDLYLCHGSADLGMNYNPLSFAAGVALHIEIYRTQLTRLGVPESIWNRHLAALERFGTSSIQRYPTQRSQTDWTEDPLDKEFRQLEENMANRIIAYGRGDPRLPQFTFEGGCGAGEQEVRITTSPRGARVSYISLFQYRLCQARNVNPEDPAHCEGWISAVKVYEDMIGKYRYLATWPDGYQAKGLFDITGRTTVNITR